MPLVDASDVQQFVVDNGSPEELIVHDDDFKLIYSIFRHKQTDNAGTFILVDETKLRSATPRLKQVDVSKTAAFAKLEKARQKAQVDEVGKVAP